MDCSLKWANSCRLCRWRFCYGLSRMMGFGIDLGQLGLGLLLGLLGVPLAIVGVLILSRSRLADDGTRPWRGRENGGPRAGSDSDDSPPD